MDLHITKINDLRGSCNKIKLDVAKSFATRKTGLVNIFNNDNKCIIWCIAASFTNKTGWTVLQKSDPENYLDMFSLISYDGIDFPISLSDITLLEKINRMKKIPLKFRINIFRENLSSNTIHMIRKSNFKDGKAVNVLLVDLIEGDTVFTHYVLIDSHSFFKKQYLSIDTKKVLSYSNNIFCSFCFQRFRATNMLEKHQELCGKPGSCFIEFPQKDQVLTFSKTEYNFKRIYNAYADFETVLVKTNKSLNCSKCPQQQKCEHSYQVEVESHEPIAVGMVIIDRDGVVVKEYYYSGKKVVENFVQEVLDTEKDLLSITKMNKYMIISREEEEEYEKTELCYICKNRKNGKYHPFSRADWRVRDHCHISVKLKYSYFLFQWLLLISMLFSQNVFMFEVLDQGFISIYRQIHRSCA